MHKTCQYCESPCVLRNPPYGQYGVAKHSVAAADYTINDWICGDRHSQTARQGQLERDSQTAIDSQTEII